MITPVIGDAWFLGSGAAAITLAVLLVVRHVFEASLGKGTRLIIDLSLFPLFAVFVSYVVARPFL
jgi:hypothetical protein